MNLDKLILVDPNLGLCQAWTEAFQKLENVEIVNDRFENLMEFDCMVSAANSYGLMDGGVDLAIINFFGPELQTDVQGHISEHYYGEQPVGTSFIARTNNASHPYVAHTPTMRVPRNIAGTEAVYQSMRAMLIAVHNFNKEENLIKIVACPGLGTATGRVPYEAAALQMSLAYKFMLEKPSRIDWALAHHRNNELINSKFLDLKNKT